MKTLKMLTMVGTVILLHGAVGFADDSYLRADHKVRGDYLRGNEARTYQQHAQDRAKMLYYEYTQPQPQIPRQDQKEAAGEIRKELTASDKALAKLKSAHAKEPDIVKLIESIEKHHAKAHEVCGMLEEECTKEHGDHVVCGQCCSDMWHELDAAQAETQKLFKMLKIDKLEPPAKKVEAKKDASKKDGAK